MYNRIHNGMTQLEHYGPNSITSIRCGFAVQLAVQQQFDKSTTSPQQIEVMEFGPP